MIKLSNYIPEIKIHPNKKIGIGTEFEFTNNMPGKLIGKFRIISEDENHWLIKSDNNKLNFRKSFFDQDLQKGNIKIIK